MPPAVATIAAATKSPGQGPVGVLTATTAATRDGHPKMAACRTTVSIGIHVPMPHPPSVGHCRGVDCRTAAHGEPSPSATPSRSTAAGRARHTIQATPDAAAQRACVGSSTNQPTIARSMAIMAVRPRRRRTGVREIRPPTMSPPPRGRRPFPWPSSHRKTHGPPQAKATQVPTAAGHESAIPPTTRAAVAVTMARLTVSADDAPLCRSPHSVTAIITRARQPATARAMIGVEAASSYPTSTVATPTPRPAKGHTIRTPIQPPGERVVPAAGRSPTAATAATAATAIASSDRGAPAAPQAMPAASHEAGRRAATRRKSCQATGLGSAGFPTAAIYGSLGRAVPCTRNGSPRIRRKPSASSWL